MTESSTSVTSMTMGGVTLQFASVTLREDAFDQENHGYRGFVRTGSVSPIIIATLTDSNIGDLLKPLRVYVRESPIDGGLPSAGLVIAVDLTGNLPAGAFVGVILYQAGAAEYLAPVLYTEI